jgi:hypothetical protein
MRTTLGSAVVAVVAAGLVSAAASPATGPRFYRDDPIARVVETQDASKAQEREISLYYDAIINLFARPGQQIVNRAESVNTIDEVPDSSWFTNRAGSRPITPDEMVRGVNDDTGPAPGKWLVSRKAGGVSAGFTIRDERGKTYFVKFDAPGWPELGTAAEAIVTRLFHALGYHLPQASIVTMQPEQLALSPDATVRLPSGKRRAMKQSDLDDVLRRAHRNPDGSYRVVATEGLAGEPLGGFLYEGTRSDDPNDVIPHENRRELRGLRVFSAWVNHTDAKALNSLDTLVEQDGRKIVRHHLIDFNASLGSSGIGVRERRDGYEYLAEVGPAKAALPAFGFRIRPWMMIDYPEYRGVGRFEARRFVPDEWRPRVPNPAYVRSRADDTFWAARKLMALPDEAIRAAVRAGHLTDPQAEAFLAQALIERRDKIGGAFLTRVNPISDPALAADGTLTFRNAAVQYGFALAPARYVAVWHRFDNETGQTERIGETEGTSEKIAAPAGALARTTPESTRPGGGAFLRVDISAAGGPHASWALPVHAWFRHSADGWRLVGFDRMPGAPPMRPGLVGAEPIDDDRQERKAGTP